MYSTSLGHRNVFLLSFLGFCLLGMACDKAAVVPTGIVSKEQVGETMNGESSFEESLAPEKVALLQKSILIEGLGKFVPEFIPILSESIPSCYIFTDNDLEIVIYARDDHEPYSLADKQYVAKRFADFQQQARKSLIKQWNEVLLLCDSYELPRPEGTAEEIVSRLQFMNCKIELEGKMESYIKYGIVASSLDLVVGFDENMKIQYVHFDG